ncbi:unnamed protein product (macronuclear) [Paramecium tetraurelia]|uniref:Uncharacterized protein n=1 Tax=Paramecium tetraurelia TaxID=5888 RepID=A0CIM8_PARTE|nr:uncharacterized protein GSPATT00007780001 [Paramecium tetraurelia]CAK70645.1 unnamed protein product [Paramecium tetraurelia]|eukprot:XP_001438042.1 hypothetical protein (macronuclear) [Paramecium tetraurelia strain d4-2]
MKQYKLDQLAQIIKRLENILDNPKPINSQYSLFRLLPTFQSEDQTSSESSTNQIIFDEQPTQDYTKNELKTFSTESHSLKLDYTKISTELRGMLQNTFRSLNIDQTNYISQVILKHTQKDNPLIALIINQLNLIQSVVEANSICQKYHASIENLQSQINNFDQQHFIALVISLRSKFFSEINKHKIDTSLVPQYDQFQLIKEQQLKIQHVQRAIDQLIQQIS